MGFPEKDYIFPETFSYCIIETSIEGSEILYEPGLFQLEQGG